MACGYCYGVDSGNADILVAEERDSNSDLDCAEGTLGNLPAVVWEDDLQCLDEELITELGSDFIFPCNENLDCTNLAADEELTFLMQQFFCL